MNLCLQDRLLRAQHETAYCNAKLCESLEAAAQKEHIVHCCLHRAAAHDFASLPTSLQVVVQPYLQMVLRSLSAVDSMYIKSAAVLPVEWRYMIELSVHNSSPVDIKASPSLCCDVHAMSDRSILTAQALTRPNTSAYAQCRNLISNHGPRV